MARTKASERDRREARRRILDEAGAAFAERGFNGASLDRIAGAAGITRAGLLYHFETKEQLLIAVLDDRDAQLEHLTGMDLAPLSLLEIFDRWEVIITSITAQAGLIKLAHALESEAVATDHPARTWVRDRNRGVREQFETSIRLSIERDEIREDIDVAALASILLGIVDGLESQWLIDSDSVDILRANLHAIHLLRTALT